MHLEVFIPTPKKIPALFSRFPTLSLTLASPPDRFQYTSVLNDPVLRREIDREAGDRMYSEWVKLCGSSLTKGCELKARHA